MMGLAFPKEDMHMYVTFQGKNQVLCVFAWCLLAYEQKTHFLLFG